MFNPYFALAGGVALLAAAGGSFVKGEQYANAKHDQAQLTALTDALADAKTKQTRIDQLDAEEPAPGKRPARRVREIDHETTTDHRTPGLSQCVH
jgi:hypothetical protein